jgi:hypothetical protein
MWQTRPAGVSPLAHWHTEESTQHINYFNIMNTIPSRSESPSGSSATSSSGQRRHSNSTSPDRGPTSNGPRASASGSAFQGSSTGLGTLTGGGGGVPASGSGRSASGPGSRKMRKKTAKACLACQKSHVTCDAGEWTYHQNWRESLPER